MKREKEDEKTIHVFLSNGSKVEILLLMIIVLLISVAIDISFKFNLSKEVILYLVSIFFTILKSIKIVCEDLLTKCKYDEIDFVKFHLF